MIIWKENGWLGKSASAGKRFAHTRLHVDILVRSASFIYVVLSKEKQGKHCG